MVACGVRLHAADWPRWRGPEGNGHVPAGVAVPKTLPEEPKVIWRVRIGDGLASPVVSGGKVFYLDNQQDKETVHAADAATGNELWSASFDDVHKDGWSRPGPRCAPVADGERVYVQSCRGEFQCRNSTNGKLIWRTNFLTDFGAVYIGEKGDSVGASRHGYTGPPFIVGNRIVVGVGGTSGASVVCFDKKTGRVVWKSQSDVPGFSGPLLATLAGIEHIVSFTAEAVMGLDVRSGALLWRFPVKTAFGRHATTPVIVADMVLVSSYQVGLIALRISREGKGLKVEQAWVARESAINFASPVAVGNCLYGVGPTKNLFCVDVRTGKQMWSQAGFLSTSFERGYASFVVMGDNLLVLTDSGQLLLIAADPKEYREISRTQVCGATWCSPAYAGGKLFLRDGQELLCIQLLP